MFHYSAIAGRSRGDIFGNAITEREKERKYIIKEMLFAFPSHHETVAVLQLLPAAEDFQSAPVRGDSYLKSWIPDMCRSIVVINQARIATNWYFLVCLLYCRVDDLAVQLTAACCYFLLFPYLLYYFKMKFSVRL